MMDMTPDRADFLARAFVNGMVDEIKHGERTGRKVIHTAHWSDAFAGHPWVEASDKEGWGRDLRMVITLAVKRRMMIGQPHHDINQLMPSKDWVEYVREKSSIEAEAVAWRNAMAEKHGTFDAYITKHKSGGYVARPLGDATRDAMKGMQRESRNRRLHLEPLAELTGISKRMSSDR